LSTTKRAGAKADATMNELRDHTAETREDLGGTVSVLADKADVKARTSKAARKPGVWATVGAAAVTAGAAVGAMRWRQARRTPRSRAARAWKSVTDRFGR
jgi:hypothetical protein